MNLSQAIKADKAKVLLQAGRPLRRP